MASIFECEVRYKIDNIKNFENNLKKLGAELSFSYSFTDYYYKPAKVKWNPIEKILRIREWQKPKRPTEILFVKNEILKIGDLKFKRSLYPQGKLPLFSGSLSVCKKLLLDLDFAPWFTLKKLKGNFWKLPKYKFITVNEYVKDLGWSGELEFEGRNPKKAKRRIEKSLKTLEINKNSVSFEPISVIFAKKNKLM